MAHLTEFFRLPRMQAPHGPALCGSLLDERDASAAVPFAFGRYLVEWVEADQLDRYRSEWAELAARSLEANIFLDPAFALAAAKQLPGREQRKFLLVWSRNEATQCRKLSAFWPFARPRAGPGASHRTWVHPYCCSGAPLLDETEAFSSLEAVVAFLKASSRIATISIPQVREEGAFLSLLRRFAIAEGLPFEILSRFDRAVLDATAPEIASKDFVSRKKRKELGRQLRRLRERGPVAFGLAEQGEPLSEHVSGFLALESKGWKGRRGGAFLNDSRHAAFLAEMANAMGGAGKCQIYWMSCGKKVIARNIVLLDGPSAYFWKTAYDEDYAAASPGVLLTMAMTDRILREQRVLSIDSCAKSDHPMIDRIWPDRLGVADVAIALRADSRRDFDVAIRRERLFRRLREMAKAARSRLGL